MAPRSPKPAKPVQRRTRATRKVGGQVGPKPIRMTADDTSIRVHESPPIRASTNQAGIQNQSTLMTTNAFLTYRDSGDPNTDLESQVSGAQVPTVEVPGVQVPEVQASGAQVPTIAAPEPRQPKVRRAQAAANSIQIATPEQPANNPSSPDEYRRAEGYIGLSVPPLANYTPITPTPAASAAPRQPTVILAVASPSPIARSIPEANISLVTSEGSNNQSVPGNLAGSTPAVGQVASFFYGQPKLKDSPGSDRMSGVMGDAPVTPPDPMEIDNSPKLTPKQIRWLKTRSRELDVVKKEVADLRNHLESTKDKYLKYKQECKALKKTAKGDKKRLVKLKKDNADCFRPLTSLLKAINDELYVDREKDEDYIRWRNLLKH